MSITTLDEEKSGKGRTRSQRPAIARAVRDVRIRNRALMACRENQRTDTGPVSEGVMQTKNHARGGLSYGMTRSCFTDGGRDRVAISHAASCPDGLVKRWFMDSLTLRHVFVQLLLAACGHVIDTTVRMRLRERSRISGALQTMLLLVFFCAVAVNVVEACCGVR